MRYTTSCTTFETLKIEYGLILHVAAKRFLDLQHFYVLDFFVGNVHHQKNQRKNKGQFRLWHKGRSILRFHEGNHYITKSNALLKGNPSKARQNCIDWVLERPMFKVSALFYTLRISNQNQLPTDRRHRPTEKELILLGFHPDWTIKNMGYI